MPPLDPQLRRRLENTVVAARGEAEAGARAALQSLGVHHHEPYGHMKPAERALRNHLRARARQLGDTQNARGELTVDHLAHECAYEHWHRMLFARFLAENNLLIDPQMKVAVSLKECEEIAEKEGVVGGTWALAGRFAQSMLPQIFRPDDPLLSITLPTERRVALEGLLADLPPAVFTADDSLGWVYQFWQRDAKNAANDGVKSGVKIDADTLPAVTQLFTEHYMVLFLLHNTIGAWHAGKVLSARATEAAKCASEADVRRLVALPGYDYEFLRFVKDDIVGGAGWRPAAGVFEGWPKHAKDLKVLDPCCGSGHFLVAALELLVRVRMQEERMSVADAIAGVIGNNLFGLEIDLRCTQIAAFNVAIAAWKMIGKVIPLPDLHIACSGIGPSATLEQWLKLAGPGTKAWDSLPVHGREPVKNGLANLHRLFSQAPELGSLLNPDELPSDLITADWETMQPFLAAALKAESADENILAQAVAAQGMAKAAEILAGPTDGYTLAVTNVPYLAMRRQSPPLRAHLEANLSEAKADLATAFIDRFIGMRPTACSLAAVTPQHWLFQDSYTELRGRLLQQRSWHLVAKLGPGAFETITGVIVNVALVVLGESRPEQTHVIAGLDCITEPSATLKAEHLRTGIVLRVTQQEQRDNPDSRVTLGVVERSATLQDHADAPQGIITGDLDCWQRKFWEVAGFDDRWKPFLSTTSTPRDYAGRDNAVDWLNEGREMIRPRTGNVAIGRRGVAISQTGNLPASLYCGELYDGNVAPIVPHHESDLPAIWAFCLSDDFQKALRIIDKNMKVTNGVLLKAPFDVQTWQDRAHQQFPDGVPEPESDDPTQWLFHGHPSAVTDEGVLQVATVRLAGYQWPAELDPDMRLAVEARELVDECQALDHFADDDGVVPLVPMRGEVAAESRLRDLLRASFEGDWSSAKEASLLAATSGSAATSLDDWLKNRFFDQHCALFGHRPFVWHIWDGRKKDGFGVLVHYHRLVAPDGAGRQLLEKITHGYLGDWINRQRDEVKANKDGAEARLAAALDLQKNLEAILVGEPPYDIFVRWKPLHEQPIGWEPDINDGVRINIRPFIEAGVLRGRVNVKWTKDRGKEPQSLRPRADFPWFWGWDEHAEDFAGGTTFHGDRFNDLHYTNAFKQAARERKAQEATA